VKLRLFGACVAVAAGVIAWSVRSPAQAPGPEQLARPAQSAGGIQGVGGCAAAGCHNAPLSPGSVGTEYGTWVHDPHGRAFATLDSPLYKGILSRLKGTAYTEELCLKCHATPTGDGSPLAKVLLADGIGCESCHGPAEKWRTTHYQRSWKSLSEAEKEKLDFFPTKDVGRRIEMCAGCHVGNAEKDVNHDLVAAGHPRLNFEYTAYHHLLTPRHWQEPYEKSKSPSDWEARTWALGQATTAKAAVELTAARAKSAGQPTHPWPEFSEYGCFACHHELKPGESGSTWRQNPRYANTAPGSFPWGTWVRPEPESLARVKSPLSPPGDPLEELAAVLSRPSPSARDTQAKAAEVAGKLEAWRKQVTEVPPLGAGGVRKLLAGLAADDIAHPPREWDDAAQQYLALAALYQSLTDLDPAAGTPNRRELFLGLRRVLIFPPAGEKRRYDSPAEFTPEKCKSALQPFATEFRTPDAP
jgi:hypothetical protein